MRMFCCAVLSCFSRCPIFWRILSRSLVSCWDSAIFCSANFCISAYSLAAFWSLLSACFFSCSNKSWCLCDSFLLRSSCLLSSCSDSASNCWFASSSLFDLRSCLTSSSLLCTLSRNWLSSVSCSPIRATSSARLRFESRMDSSNSVIVFVRTSSSCWVLLFCSSSSFFISSTSTFKISCSASICALSSSNVILSDLLTSPNPI
mmetsp:Transcript_27951/g.54340  ORF Transcript_27951/g.54340 Transcript_27951/m.54340 type:complete len:204 (+) Transcript_27951:815-1426(+)